MSDLYEKNMTWTECAKHLYGEQIEVKELTEEELEEVDFFFKMNSDIKMRNAIDEICRLWSMVE